MEILKTRFVALSSELSEFIRFLGHFFKWRLIHFGVRFEKIKDVVVAILIVKRGKYSQSFLNTSFFLLVSAAIIAGPTIAENNPFLGNYFAGNPAPQNSVLAYDIYSVSTETSVSEKPRDKVIDHTVAGGDTLASIADTFGVSVDTIKWANNLKSDTIKPGQLLKISPVTGVVHTVAAGDTIYSIAKKYKTDAQKILNFPFNDFEDPDTFALVVGQPLVVPDGVIEEARPIRLPGSYRGPIIAGAPGSGSFNWPTSGGITQYPVWYHMAVDVANPSNPPVLAADSGTVTFSGCMAWGYGCHIIISHNNGYETLYGHLSSLGVSAGQVVGKGQQIGIMGSTGRSTGTHLHFEIRQGGVLLNPLNFLK